LEQVVNTIMIEGSSWPWSYGSWVYNQCEVYNIML